MHQKILVPLVSLGSFLLNQARNSPGPLLGLTLFLVSINEMFCTTSNFIHSYVGDCTFLANFQRSKPPSYLEIDSNGKTICTKLPKDPERALE